MVCRLLLLSCQIVRLQASGKKPAVPQLSRLHFKGEAALNYKRQTTDSGLHDMCWSVQAYSTSDLARSVMSLQVLQWFPTPAVTPDPRVHRGHEKQRQKFPSLRFRAAFTSLEIFGNTQFAFLMKEGNVHYSWGSVNFRGKWFVLRLENKHIKNNFSLGGGSACRHPHLQAWWDSFKKAKGLRNRK